MADEPNECTPQYYLHNEGDMLRFTVPYKKTFFMSQSTATPPANPKDSV